jgi:hypothetical protein
MFDLLPDFTPADWYWQVAGRSDYWSSAAAAYVEALPQGRLCTPIATEADLGDVLRTYGLVVPAPTEVDYAAAILSMLDAAARQRGYDDIQSAVSYRDDPNATFAQEGQAYFAWRSAVWTYAYAELDKVQSGARAQPSVADFLTELPALAL